MSDETAPVSPKARLNFAKKTAAAAAAAPEVDTAAVDSLTSFNALAAEPVDEDAIDASIAPLAPSTLLVPPSDDEEVSDDDAQTGDYGAAVEAEAIAEPAHEELTEAEPIDPEPESVPEEVEAEVDQAEGMDMTEVPVEVAESGTLDEITAEDDAAREAMAAQEDSILNDGVLDQLEADKAALEAQIAERKELEKHAVCDQIKVVMGQYGVTIDFLADHMGVKFKRKGTKAKPKYRDPATGTTWSGRGKMPNWLKGVADISVFLI